MPSQTASSLLDAIHRLGERMQDALDRGDFDAFYGLVAERGALIDALPTCEPDLLHGSEMSRVAGILKEQHATLESALLRRQADVQLALTDLQKLKTANRTYASPAPRGGILHAGVKG